MARTAADLSSDEIDRYCLTARRRARTWQESVKRRKSAWNLAHQAAQLLRDHFEVSRVTVFGSLVHEGCFTSWSDVDIAVWGLRPEDTFRAMDMVRRLDPENPANLVDINTASRSLRAVIEAEGVEI